MLLLRHADEASFMRTTLSIDDALLERAKELTGATGRSALEREGLKALIERESAKRPARLGGSEPDLTLVPRRRLGNEQQPRRAGCSRD
jgi:hypothetical protein